MMIGGHFDSDWRHFPSPDAGSMLGQRRRRWANIEWALGERPVFFSSLKPPTL